MRALVIETATAACSVALVEGHAVIASAHITVGRGHAERLLPMIADLPDGGRCDEILVDCGPGSFTGIRVGVAAARGLGLGWGVPVRGYSSLALIAAAGFAPRPQVNALAVIMEGGHGEVFMQGFTCPPFATAEDLVSLHPAAAIEQLSGRHLIGNGIRFLTALAPGLEATEALPNAIDLLHLPDSFTRLPATPIYGRAPDAKPMATA